MRNENPLNDLERQHWLNQPTPAELKRSLHACLSWALAGWCAALFFAALLFWSCAR